MDVIIAEKAGFCFGVKRAVQEAVDAQNKFHKKIYTLGPLIHNNDVVSELKKKNIHPLDLKDVGGLNEGDVIIIRSHGVSPDIIELLKKKNLVIIDATCPYVTNIHKKVEKYSALGYQIIIVGDQLHPEVIGINGYCNNEALISKDGTDLTSLPNKVCIVAQTTEKQENWEKVLHIVVEQCKEFIAFNTICSATEVRQKSAAKISTEVDMMIVIGGYNSSNTTKLYEICKDNCGNTIHVETGSEILKSTKNFKNVKKIGVTAGASTPDWIIKEAVLKMKENKDMEMNEQLAFMDQNTRQIIVGDVIVGKIISVNDKEAYVNINYKADGLLPKNEVSKEDGFSLKDLFKIGDSVKVKVISRKNEDGYVVLSKTEVEKVAVYEALKEAFQGETPIQVRMKEIVKGGIVASYKGVRIFIPASHLDLFHVNDLTSYVNKDTDIKIIEFKEDKRGFKIVGSRKELLKIERDKIQEETWKVLQDGKEFIGEVKRLTAFGAFLDIEGVDGLLHVSEMSWGKVNKPTDFLRVGDKVPVVILKADHENKKLSLSIKKLTENPWDTIETKYPVGSVVLGKVVRFAKFGAFLELEPGVDALVHISQISHQRVNEPGDVLEIGQEVKAKIVEVKSEEKKIGLSIKELNEI